MRIEAGRDGDPERGDDEAGDARAGGAEPAQAAGDSGERGPDQCHQQEGKPEAERVGREQDRPLQRLSGDSGQRQGRAEERPNAGRLADAENDPERQRRDEAEPAEALRHLEPEVAVCPGQPEDAGQEQAEDGHE